MSGRLTFQRVQSKQLELLKKCASYLLAISGHSRTEYRTELSPTHISLAKQVSDRILQQYLSHYTKLFEALLRQSILWMKAPRLAGMNREVAAWVLSGLSELVRFQTEIPVPGTHVCVWGLEALSCLLGEDSCC